MCAAFLYTRVVLVNHAPRIRVYNEKRNEPLFAAHKWQKPWRGVRTRALELGEVGNGKRFWTQSEDAPVSGLTAPMNYDCSFIGESNREKDDFILRVRVPVSTLCPCSKEISDYGAHNQRDSEMKRRPRIYCDFSDNSLSE